MKNVAIVARPIPMNTHLKDKSLSVRSSISVPVPAACLTSLMALESPVPRLLRILYKV